MPKGKSRCLKPSVGTKTKKLTVVAIGYRSDAKVRNRIASNKINGTKRRK